MSTTPPATARHLSFLMRWTSIARRSPRLVCRVASRTDSTAIGCQQDNSPWGTGPVRPRLPASPTHRLAILAMVGPCPVEAVRALSIRAGRRRDGRDQDRLEAAYRSAVDRDHVVPHAGEVRADQGMEVGLELEQVRHLKVVEARHVGRRLQIGAEIEYVHQ